MIKITKNMNVITDAQIDMMMHALEAAHAETGNRHIIEILDIITPKLDNPTLESCWLKFIESVKDKCPRCGTRHPLVVQFGYCGRCAEIMYR